MNTISIHTITLNKKATIWSPFYFYRFPISNITLLLA